MSARRAAAALLTIALGCSSTATVGQLTAGDAAISDVPGLDATIEEPMPPLVPAAEAAAPEAGGEDSAAAPDASSDAAAPEASVGCAGDGDCPTGRICAGGVCVQCVSDQQCVLAEEPRCDQRGRCVECTSTEQCSAGRVCAPWGECEPSCSRDAQCFGGLRCDALAGVCLECVADGDCVRAGEFCDEGVCRPCAFDTDCPN